MQSVQDQFVHCDHVILQTWSEVTPFLKIYTLGLEKRGDHLVVTGLPQHPEQLAELVITPSKLLIPRVGDFSQ